jgi:RNA polymerase sigma-70 factor (ECF subfamily)
MAKAVARNVISCRRRKLGQSLDVEDGLLETLGEEMDPAEASITAESTELMRKRIEELPPSWREALVLREQQEMAYRDIALTLGATEAQVKTWLHRARARLAGQLAGDETRSTPSVSAGSKQRKGDI